MQATHPDTVCLEMSPSSSGRDISFQTLRTNLELPWHAVGVYGVDDVFQ